MRTIVAVLIASACVAASPVVEPRDPTSPSTTAPSTRRAGVTYTLSPGSERWPADKRAQIVAAMDRAVALYNDVGTFDKRITVSFSPDTPTADGNVNGHIRFGGQIGYRTALHELGHCMGVGQHSNWRKLMVDGKWTGPHALAQLRAFDGPDAVLKGDRQHFWPYGLNYDKESSPENDRRHVMMVAALMRDMGIGE